MQHRVPAIACRHAGGTGCGAPPAPLSWAIPPASTHDADVWLLCVCVYMIFSYGGGACIGAALDLLGALSHGHLLGLSTLSSSARYHVDVPARVRPPPSERRAAGRAVRDAVARC